ncbi:hypothetical protein [Haloplanus rubicundus]|uniref:Domain of unknown function domain-containing protein n=1 Tax=Haloplanus rubicundus TaxID=1547898 RepID=A0A345E8A1_9EURY|nr:hypothetical protein [Haloplanus rubicundus]AXG08423.1 hypothetical protein DU484_00370 [Haloplanus rubicundus]
MTDHTSTPEGLLTYTEREQLQDSETSRTTRNDVRERVRDRLEATLEDIRVLYPTLRESDIESVFTGPDDQDPAEIRVATQDALALFVLGMLYNDDHLEWRLSEAIRNATLDYGEDVSVDIDIRRGPFPTVEYCLGRFDREGMTPENLALFDRLLFRSEADAEQMATAAESLGIDATPDQVQDGRTGTSLERFPQTAIVNVDHLNR